MIDLIDDLAKRLEAAYYDFSMRFCVRRKADNSCCEVIEQAEQDIVSNPVNAWRFNTWNEAKEFHDTMLWRYVAKAAMENIV